MAPQWQGMALQQGSASRCPGLPFSVLLSALQLCMGVVLTLGVVVLFLHNYISQTFPSNAAEMDAFQQRREDAQEAQEAHRDSAAGGPAICTPRQFVSLLPRSACVKPLLICLLMRNNACHPSCKTLACLPSRCSISLPGKRAVPSCGPAPAAAHQQERHAGLPGSAGYPMHAHAAPQCYCLLLQASSRRRSPATAPRLAA